MAEEQAMCAMEGETDPRGVPIRHANEDEYLMAIAGVDFPVSKSAVLRKAMDKGGIDGEVHRVLGQVEDRSYESWEDLRGEIDRVYASGGGMPPTKPAAPS
jgi:hypothetical protein